MDKIVPYSVTRGEQFFNWNEFLSVPMEQRSFKELTLAKRYSRNWVTCACGNECQVIARCSDGSPLDSYLQECGLDFTVAVHAGDTEKAKLILGYIENRSAFLIREAARKSL